jgi:hypothetical protein
MVISILARSAAVITGEAQLAQGCASAPRVVSLGGHRGNRNTSAEPHEGEGAFTGIARFDEVQVHEAQQAARDAPGRSQVAAGGRRRARARPRHLVAATEMTPSAPRAM